MPDPSYSGRLELTWTNKDQRLLAHEDGSYEWVAPADYRVAEVHLLDNQGTVGKVHGDDERAKDNLLIRGDALQALTSLLSIPEFRDEYAGKVKLAYLDPPFNTQQAFEHYDDALEHSVWLTMMRDRLQLVKTLLSPHGSVWVHCDDSEQAYLKVMMDEVFGRENFVACVTWQKADSPRMDAQQFSASQDYILVFGRGRSWRPNADDVDPTDLKHLNLKDEAGRPYRLLTLRKTGANSRREDRPNLWYPIVHDGIEYWPIKPDGSEGNWRWGRETYGRNSSSIVWIDRGYGLQPYVRSHSGGEATRPPETLWLHKDAGHNREAKSHLKKLFGTDTFATPKPERLLKRVVEIGSDPGDIVLDCFLGSGTTVAVAQKMGRRWIGVERSEGTLTAFAAPRLIKVVRGEDPGGITKEVGWQGGGGFRILDVAPSMFCEEGGIVYLADWATSGKLAEATAAQLGYTYDSDSPFAGRLGRSRLAVIDGLVNEAVVRVLATVLLEDERVVVCGTAIDPAARDVLAALRPGSSVRKIPSSILQEYRLARRAPFTRTEEPEAPLQPSLLSSEAGTWP